MKEYNVDMDIKKCDLCQKEIKDRKKYVSVRFIYDWTELCDDCGAPVLKFLQKNKFLNKKDIKEN